MRLALIGFGKMGQEIARCAEGQHSIQVVIDPNHDGSKEQKAKSMGARFYSSIAEATWDDVDVAIEFSKPEAVLTNIIFLGTKGINTVVGTTGWYKHMEEMKKQVKKSRIGLIWGSNFSLGIHLFWNILAHAASVMNHCEEYDVFGHEFHHRAKADSPSGTAKTTAEMLLKHLDRKTEWTGDRIESTIKHNQLHFSSTRGGHVPGTHQVFFDSPADTIEVTHTARNRSGFAKGALRCAEWIRGKTGFFSIEDYMKEILNHPCENRDLSTDYQLLTTN